MICHCEEPKGDEAISCFTRDCFEQKSTAITTPHPLARLRRDTVRQDRCAVGAGVTENKQ